MRSRLLALSLLIALSFACGDGPSEPLSQPCPEGGLARSEAQCLAGGGAWVLNGVKQIPICVCPAPDAGKPCTRQSDCTSACLAEDTDPETCDARTVGRCSEQLPLPFSCYCYVGPGTLLGGTDTSTTNVLLCRD